MLSHVEALRRAGTRKRGHKCTSAKDMRGHTGTQVSGYCGATTDIQVSLCNQLIAQKKELDPCQSSHNNGKYLNEKKTLHAHA